MKNSTASDLKTLVSIGKTRRTKAVAYGFVFAFVACTAFLAFNPSSNTAAPWFNNLFSSSSISTSIAPYRSQVSTFFSHFFPNSSSPSPEMGVPVENPVKRGVGSSKDAILGAGSGGSGVPEKNSSVKGIGPGKNGVLGKNQTEVSVGVKKDGALAGKNQTGNGVPEKSRINKGFGSDKIGVLGKNQTEKGVGVQKDGVLEGKNQTAGVIGSTGSGVPEKNPGKNGVLGQNQTEVAVGVKKSGVLDGKNQTGNGNVLQGTVVSVKNQTVNGVPTKRNGVPQNESRVKNQTESKKGSTPSTTEEHKGAVEGTKVSNFTASLGKGNGSVAPATNGSDRKRAKWIEALIGCDIFQGKWVKDDSYPLYPEGSCPHIDEPFDCYLNGRPDRAYQKLRWKPNGCDIPRLNAADMLERLRGKRLVFVGDSLNRNMWESLVCILRNSVKDKKKVFEASGRHAFRTEGSYSFLFKDYNSTVEFFRSPFLVQEWEMPDGNGTKETLRLDIIERSSSKYKDAHVIVFNTGHWWTHEKTSKGRDYYQEGNRVYNELNVVEAFHKALNTWAKWVDANVNPKKTLVFFRGYSASHFRGGQWNSGGACDRETEPIKNEKYLSSYPPKMSVLESVIKGMKTPVSYLNITRMTDYRKDAHPSIYRKQNLTDEERREPERYQDCSHWCLPGVPDSWNELLYAQLIIKQYQMAQ